MRTILVTGCAGFIGSHVTTSLLKKGYKVIGVDNFDKFYSRSVKEKNLEPFRSSSNFQFYNLDITDKASLEQLPAIDALIHLAAKAGVLPSLRDPKPYIDTNIVGTNNLLELMRERACKKMLFASSSSVYGNNTKIPFSESDDVNEPISPYAFTKRSCELMNYNYHKLYDLDIINLRFFTVYGPSQRPDLAIHKFFNLIAEGKSITMYGDGSTARDYTYVEDTVSGVIAALEYVLNHEKVFETVNLGNNQPIQLKELISTIYKVIGKEPNIKQEEMKPGDVNVTFADISKAQKLFAYNPQTSFVEGIEKFKKWHERNYRQN